jgi:hypothetical protein
MSQGARLSPTATSRKAASTVPIVPLDAPERTTPIHLSLPGIKVPAVPADGPPIYYHPATLVPLLSPADIAQNPQHRSQLQQLQKQHATPEQARRALEEAVREVQSRIDAGERVRKEIERQMEDKEKTRELERKLARRAEEERKGLRR